MKESHSVDSFLDVLPVNYAAGHVRPKEIVAIDRYVCLTEVFR
jgi:hypothetical protein